MKARIHRGAHEIGGSCVEVEHEGSRIVLDVGLPLDAEGEVPLPSAVDESVLAVLISHAHQDHWGLAGQIPSSVPIFMGEATHRILDEAAFWTTGLTVEPGGFLRHREPFELGPFRVMPFLNDHSAFDAYSLLVEAGGRKLFYTGDIRGHGRKAAIFKELLRKPPSDVDVLLMEGTNVRSDDGVDREATGTETAVEMACAATLQGTEGLVPLIYSAQNIDRMVTLFRAAKRSGRTFVMDLYGASIARATGSPNIPKPGKKWPQVRVFVPHWQRVKVKEAGEFHRVEEIKAVRVYEKALAADPSRFVVAANLQTLRFLNKAGALEEARVVWSMWPGYLKENSGKQLQSFLSEHGIPMTIHHTSGHASVKDLRRLAKAISAKRLVPIHSFGSDKFTDLFDHVEQHPDGEWWGV